MRALNRKLLRDLGHLRGQVIAIGMVVASGVGVLVMSLSVHEALLQTAEAYYERYHFADVFAGVKRAPMRLAQQAAEIPGVQTVETRISRLATLDIEGFDEPVIGRIVSLPEHGTPRLNDLALRDGRFVAPGRPDEVVLNEPFAEAQELVPGDSFKALINGNKRDLKVVGIALSPEFVYAIGPGSLMPDDKRYGILWMGREAMAAAYDLDGAFNDISLTLLRGVDPEAVIERLDKLLEGYGGIGAVKRADQISNWFLMNEIAQIETLATIMPTIFIAVAAFLANMVLTRLIATERAEIGLMKAFGYSNFEVGWHYVKLVMVMTGFGIILGWIVGAILGRVTTELYTEFYRFPLLIYRPGLASFVIGGCVSMLAGVLGTLSAVRRAAALPPAEAMRPPEPMSFRRSSGLFARATRWLDHPTRIVLRQMTRVPIRSGLTSLGVAMAVGVVIMAMQWLDSVDELVQVYFMDAQHQDVMVGLVESQSTTALAEFARMPGVLSVEPTRIVSAKLRFGNREHRGALYGVQPDDRLQLVYDSNRGLVPVPDNGLVVSTALADKLGVLIGDHIEVEVLEARRPTLSIPVVETFETYIGMPAYMHLDGLNRLMRERPSMEYANLLIDDNQESALYRKIKDLPEVSAIMLREAAVTTFYETMAETMMIFVTFFTGFAFALGFGVVYNSARIALSERGRDLATLRVLGFTRWETAYILLAEVALLVLVALPLGCVAGLGLAWLMVQSLQTELFRIPLVIDASTYGTAMIVALLATLVSAAIVRRRLNELDLIGVLKTRE